jgi:methionyl-tRNA formyltransferase
MDPIPFFCKTKKIPYISIRKSADLDSSYEIESSMAELAIVADFGIIIPQKTLSFFSMGVINIHPSLLPKYRGPTPAQNAILNGETETGVTIIKLDKYVDHGPVIAQVAEEIKPNDTAKSLYERLFKIGTVLLQKVVVNFENSKIKPIPQNHEHATFTKALTKEDGYIDFMNFFSSKDFFERMVRAYYPWPGAWTRINVTDNENDIKIVKFLPNKRIQVEGGNEMDYKDFINGYSSANKKLIEFLKKDI